MEGPMPDFLICMRWTKKGMDEVDNVPDRRAAAIALMQSYDTITFTNGGADDDTGSQDITYLNDKSAHIVWTVTGPEVDVRDLAVAMAFHEYVTCYVRKPYAGVRRR
jgi:hypothetical protein